MQEKKILQKLHNSFTLHSRLYQDKLLSLKKNLAQKEQSTDARPAISGSIENIEQYDVIYVGYSNWWYVAPTIINTFVESYDFSGKTIVPFATSGGSGMGKTVEVLKALCPNANWEKGKMLNRVSDKELKDWLSQYEKSWKEQMK